MSYRQAAEQVEQAGARWQPLASAVYWRPSPWVWLPKKAVLNCWGEGGWACTCQPCVHAENTVGGEGKGLSGFFMQNLGKGLTLHLPVSCHRASSSGSRGYIWMALLLVPWVSCPSTQPPLWPAEKCRHNIVNSNTYFYKIYLSRLRPLEILASSMSYRLCEKQEFM